MPELLLEELETADSVEGCLEEIEELLRSVMGVVTMTVERQKGTALAFENAWRQIVLNVATGQTAEMQAARPRLLSALAKRLDLLKRTHALLTELHNRGRTDIPGPDILLAEIAGMERLKTRVFDRWHTAEDLEKLAVEHYPLSQARLQQIAATHAPPPEWYQGEEERLFEE